ALSLVIGLAAPSFAAGQEFHRYTYDFGGGFTQPVGNTGRHLDEGWNIGGGVGVNFNSYLGAMVQLGYNSFGINSASLNAAGFPGGDVHIFSATVDPIVHLNPHGHVDFYIVGGGGLYLRTCSPLIPSTSPVPISEQDLP